MCHPHAWQPATIGAPQLPTVPAGAHVHYELEETITITYHVVLVVDY
jgi:hypothetical protein